MIKRTSDGSCGKICSLKRSDLVCWYSCRTDGVLINLLSLFFSTWLAAEQEDGTERVCDTLLMCIITVLNQGLRNGGGVGDILRRPSKEVRPPS